MTQQLDVNDDAVTRLGLMDTAPEERFDRITRLAREMFDVDYAVVNVVNSETVFTKSQPAESDFRHTPIEDSFCGEAVKQPAVLEVPDGRADPRFADRAIVAEHGIRFYAGFPIHTDAGETVGTLCLLDTSPRDLSDADRDAFERFGLWAQAEMRMDDPGVSGAGPVPAASVAPAVRDDRLAAGRFAWPPWRSRMGRSAVTGAAGNRSETASSSLSPTSWARVKRPAGSPRS